MLGMAVAAAQQYACANAGRHGGGVHHRIHGTFQFVLGKLAKRYRKKLQEALPDTVDLLGIVLGTGLALDQAMMRVSDEMQYIYPELANEFYTVVMQVRAGQERAKAFQQWCGAPGLEDIKVALRDDHSERALRNQPVAGAEGLCGRPAHPPQLARRSGGGKAGIKMLFPIVIFILPVLFVITLVPGMLSVLHDLKMLGGGASASTSVR